LTPKVCVSFTTSHGVSSITSLNPCSTTGVLRMRFFFYTMFCKTGLCCLAFWAIDTLHNQGVCPSSAFPSAELVPSMYRSRDGAPHISRSSLATRAKRTPLQGAFFAFAWPITMQDIQPALRGTLKPAKACHGKHHGCQGRPMWTAPSATRYPSPPETGGAKPSTPSTGEHQPRAQKKARSARAEHLLVQAGGMSRGYRRRNPKTPLLCLL
jgi:hypothetical protein